MKILQINSVCAAGSTGRITADLSNILTQQGHDSTIAFGRGNAPQSIKSIRIGNDLDNYAHVLKTRLLDRHGFGSASATKRFVEDIKAYDPDVIHLHNIHGYYIHIGILFRYLAESGKPVVWTLHDCWAFTGHCSHFAYVGCDKWRSRCASCVQTRKYPQSLFFDNSERNFADKRALFTAAKHIHIVTPSAWLAALVKQSFLSKYPVSVINNGIDLNVFKPTQSDFRQKHGLQNSLVILGVCSRWSDKKGFNTFINLSKTLGEPYRIVMVGTDPKRRRALPPGIIGIDRTNSVRELAEIYSAADVFVNPTLDDNYPTVNLEALVCGTPVVTYRTGGSPESVGEGCGTVVEQGDYDGLARAITDCAKQPPDREHIAAYASQFAREAKFGEYIALYQSIAGEVS